MPGILQQKEQEVLDHLQSTIQLEFSRHLSSSWQENEIILCNERPHMRCMQIATLPLPLQVYSFEVVRVNYFVLIKPTATVNTINST